MKMLRQITLPALITALCVTIGGRQFKYVMPARKVTTFVWAEI
jgi:O-glycosyl hydrolase